MRGLGGWISFLGVDRGISFWRGMESRKLKKGLFQEDKADIIEEELLSGIIKQRLKKRDYGIRIT